MRWRRRNRTLGSQWTRLNSGRHDDGQAAALLKLLLEAWKLSRSKWLDSLNYWAINASLTTFTYMPVVKHLATTGKVWLHSAIGTDHVNWKPLLAKCLLPVSLCMAVSQPSPIGLAPGWRTPSFGHLFGTHVWILLIFAIELKIELLQNGREGLGVKPCKEHGRRRPPEQVDKDYGLAGKSITKGAFCWLLLKDAHKCFKIVTYLASNMLCLINSSLNAKQKQFSVKLLRFDWAFLLSWFFITSQ